MTAPILCIHFPGEGQARIVVTSDTRRVVVGMLAESKDYLEAISRLAGIIFTRDEEIKRLQAELHRERVDAACADHE